MTIKKETTESDTKNDISTGDDKPNKNFETPSISSRIEIASAYLKINSKKVNEQLKNNSITKSYIKDLFVVLNKSINFLVNNNKSTDNIKKEKYVDVLENNNETKTKFNPKDASHFAALITVCALKEPTLIYDIIKENARNILFLVTCIDVKYSQFILDILLLIYTFSTLQTVPDTIIIRNLPTAARFSMLFDEYPSQYDSLINAYLQPKALASLVEAINVSPYSLKTHCIPRAQYSESSLAAAVVGLGSTKNLDIDINKPNIWEQILNAEVNNSRKSVLDFAEATKSIILRISKSPVWAETYCPKNNIKDIPLKGLPEIENINVFDLFKEIFSVKSKYKFSICDTSNYEIGLQVLRRLSNEPRIDVIEVPDITTSEDTIPDGIDAILLKTFYSVLTKLPGVILGHLKTSCNLFVLCSVIEQSVRVPDYNVELFSSYRTALSNFWTAYPSSAIVPFAELYSTDVNLICIAAAEILDFPEITSSYGFNSYLIRHSVFLHKSDIANLSLNNDMISISIEIARAVYHIFQVLTSLCELGMELTQEFVTSGGGASLFHYLHSAPRVHSRCTEAALQHLYTRIPQKKRCYSVHTLSAAKKAIECLNKLNNNDSTSDKNKSVSNFSQGTPIFASSVAVIDIKKPCGFYVSQSENISEQAGAYYGATHSLTHPADAVPGKLSKYIATPTILPAGVHEFPILSGTSMFPSVGAPALYGVSLSLTYLLEFLGPETLVKMFLWQNTAVLSTRFLPSPVDFGIYPIFYGLSTAIHNQLTQSWCKGNYITPESRGLTPPTSGIDPILTVVEILMKLLVLGRQSKPSYVIKGPEESLNAGTIAQAMVDFTRYATKTASTPTYDYFPYCKKDIKLTIDTMDNIKSKVNSSEVEKNNITNSGESTKDINNEIVNKVKGDNYSDTMNHVDDLTPDVETLNNVINDKYISNNQPISNNLYSKVDTIDQDKYLDELEYPSKLRSNKSNSREMKNPSEIDKNNEARNKNMDRSNKLSTYMDTTDTGSLVNSRNRSYSRLNRETKRNMPYSSQSNQRRSRRDNYEESNLRYRRDRKDSNNNEVQLNPNIETSKRENYSEYNENTNSISQDPSGHITQYINNSDGEVSRYSHERNNFRSSRTRIKSRSNHNNKHVDPNYVNNDERRSRVSHHSRTNRSERSSERRRLSKRNSDDYSTINRYDSSGKGKLIKSTQLNYTESNYKSHRSDRSYPSSIEKNIYSIKETLSVNEYHDNNENIEKIEPSMRMKDTINPRVLFEPRSNRRQKNTKNKQLQETKDKDTRPLSVTDRATDNTKPDQNTQQNKKLKPNDTKSDSYRNEISSNSNIQNEKSNFNNKKESFNNENNTNLYNENSDETISKENHPKKKRDSKPTEKSFRGKKDNQRYNDSINCYEKNEARINKDLSKTYNSEKPYSPTQSSTYNDKFKNSDRSRKWPNRDSSDNERNNSNTRYNQKSWSNKNRYSQKQDSSKVNTSRQKKFTSKSVGDFASNSIMVKYKTSLIAKNEENKHIIHIPNNLFKNKYFNQYNSTLNKRQISHKISRNTIYNKYISLNYKGLSSSTKHIQDNRVNNFIYVIKNSEKYKNTLDVISKHLSNYHKKYLVIDNSQIESNFHFASDIEDQILIDSETLDNLTDDQKSSIAQELFSNVEELGDLLTNSPLEISQKTMSLENTPITSTMFRLLTEAFSLKQRNISSDINVDRVLQLLKTMTGVFGFSLGAVLLEQFLPPSELMLVNHTSSAWELETPQSYCTHCAVDLSTYGPISSINHCGACGGEVRHKVDKDPEISRTAPSLLTNINMVEEARYESSPHQLLAAANLVVCLLESGYYHEDEKSPEYFYSHCENLKSLNINTNILCPGGINIPHNIERPSTRLEDSFIRELVWNKNINKKWCGVLTSMISNDALSDSTNNSPRNSEIQASLKYQELIESTVDDFNSNKSNSIHSEVDNTERKLVFADYSIITEINKHNTQYNTRLNSLMDISNARGNRYMREKTREQLSSLNTMATYEKNLIDFEEILITTMGTKSYSDTVDSLFLGESAKINTIFHPDYLTNITSENSLTPNIAQELAFLLQSANEVSDVNSTTFAASDMSCRSISICNSRKLNARHEDLEFTPAISEEQFLRWNQYDHSSRHRHDSAIRNRSPYKRNRLGNDISHNKRRCFNREVFENDRWQMHQYKSGRGVNWDPLDEHQTSLPVTINREQVLTQPVQIPLQAHRNQREPQDSLDYSRNQRIYNDSRALLGSRPRADLPHNSLSNSNFSVNRNKYNTPGPVQSIPDELQRETNSYMNFNGYTKYNETKKENYSFKSNSAKENPWEAPEYLKPYIEGAEYIQHHEPSNSNYIRQNNLKTVKESQAQIHMEFEELEPIEVRELVLDTVSDVTTIWETNSLCLTEFSRLHPVLAKLLTDSKAIAQWSALAASFNLELRDTWLRSLELMYTNFRSTSIIQTLAVMSCSVLNSLTFQPIQYDEENKVGEDIIESNLADDFDEPEDMFITAEESRKNLNTHQRSIKKRNIECLKFNFADSINGPKITDYTVFPKGPSEELKTIVSRDYNLALRQISAIFHCMPALVQFVCSTTKIKFEKRESFRGIITRIKCPQPHSNNFISLCEVVLNLNTAYSPALMEYHKKLFDIYAKELESYIKLVQQTARSTKSARYNEIWSEPPEKQKNLVSRLKAISLLLWISVSSNAEQLALPIAAFNEPDFYFNYSILRRAIDNSVQNKILKQVSTNDTISAVGLRQRMRTTHVDIYQGSSTSDLQGTTISAELADARERQETAILYNFTLRHPHVLKLLKDPELFKTDQELTKKFLRDITKAPLVKKILISRFSLSEK